jgi:uncharacterized protein (TIGR02147 family)
MAPQITSIFDFADFRKFLDDYQKRRQAQDRSFTRSKFCRELGLPNTRSFFNDIVKGTRTLSKTYIERFIVALNMNENEAQYFRVLVDFNQSSIPRERESLFDQLVSLNSTPSRLVTADEYEFYRHWHHTTIFSLLDILDFTDDFSGLAKRIFPAISAAEARESIALLKKLGLIHQTADGFWKPTAKTLDTGAYVKSELVQQYQLQCLELSKRAMLLDHRAPRNFSTVTLSVSQAGCALIEKKLQKFKSEVRSIAHREAAPADRVYQLNVQYFPQSLPERAS